MSLNRDRVPDLEHRLGVMDELIRHRGPDGHQVWLQEAGRVGFEHRRLSFIDLATGD